MPYDHIKQLPDSVQNVLPNHAQEIYLGAFNQAWEHYENPEKRQDDASREETAHKVAWAADFMAVFYQTNGLAICCWAVLSMLASNGLP
jgi:cation transport regulator